MTKDEARATLINIADFCNLATALHTQDERAVWYQHLAEPMAKIARYCASHAPDCVGHVKHLDDAVFSLHQGGVSREETDDHLAAVRAAMTALEQCIHSI